MVAAVAIIFSLLFFTSAFAGLEATATIRRVHSAGSFAASVKSDYGSIYANVRALSISNECAEKDVILSRGDTVRLTNIQDDRFLGRIKADVVVCDSE